MQIDLDEYNFGKKVVMLRAYAVRNYLRDGTPFVPKVNLALQYVIRKDLQHQEFLLLAWHERSMKFLSRLTGVTWVVSKQPKKDYVNVVGYKPNELFSSYHRFAPLCNPLGWLGHLTNEDQLIHKKLTEF